MTAAKSPTLPKPAIVVREIPAGDIVAALLMLGRDNEAIAEYLRIAQIGDCEPNSRDCPIAVWLSSMFGSQASVGPDTITIGGTLIRTPKVIQDFVAWTDACHACGLMAPTAKAKKPK